MPAPEPAVHRDAPRQRPSLPDRNTFREGLATAGISYEVIGRGVLDFPALRKAVGTGAAARGPGAARDASTALKSAATEASGLGCKLESG